MSIKVINYVMESSKSKGAQRCVLLAIADRADEQGVCWPSIDRIAHRANVSPRHTKRLIQELEKSRELIVCPGQGRSGGRGSTTHKYVIPMECNQTVVNECVESGMRKHDNRVTPPMTTVSPNSMTTVSPNSMTTVSPDTSLVVTKSSSNSVTPSVTETPKKVKRSKKAKKADSIPKSERDKIFDAVAEHIWEIKDTVKLKGQGSVVGSIVNAIIEMFINDFKAMNADVAVRSVRHCATLMKRKNQLGKLQYKSSFVPAYAKYIEEYRGTILSHLTDVSEGVSEYEDMAATKPKNRPVRFSDDVMKKISAGGKRQREWMGQSDGHVS